MSFIIGFGSTETEREAAQERAIRDYVAEQYDYVESWFSDEFVGGIREWLNDEAKRLRVADASYKAAADHPDRYGSFYPTVIADASHIVFILRWVHTNRRHGLSPDGWAALRTKQVFYIDKWDDLDSRAPAESDAP